MPPGNICRQVLMRDGTGMPFVYPIILASAFPACYSILRSGPGHFPPPISSHLDFSGSRCDDGRAAASPYPIG